MKTVGVLFGVMVVIVGVLLLLTGGGCTIMIVSTMLSKGLHGGPYLIVSLAVLTFGCGLIWIGVMLIKQ